MTTINQPETNSNDSAKKRRDRLSKIVYIILDNFVWVLGVDPRMFNQNEIAERDRQGVLSDDSD